MRYITDRALYRTVKKYDHEKFDEFCGRVYAEGYDAGKSAAKSPEIENLMASIRHVEGIGPKRAERIRQALSKVLEA